MNDLNNFQEFKLAISQDNFIKELLRKADKSAKKDFWRLVERNLSIGSQVYNGRNVNNNSNRISVMMGIILEEEFSNTLTHFGIKHIYANNNDCDFVIHKPFQMKTARDKDKTDEKLAGSTSKTISNNYTIQGATHCSSDCFNYIIIRYGLNMTEKLGDQNCKIFKSFHLSILEDVIQKDYWQGKATSNNSRTTLRVPILAYDEMKEGLIYGKTVKAKKYIQLKTTEVNY